MHFIFAESWSNQVFGGFNGVIGIIWWILVIVGGWKMLRQSRQARLRLHHPVLQRLPALQGRRPAGLVADPVLHPHRQHRHLVHRARSTSRSPFGHGAGYAILLWLFAPIMLLVLGFGGDTYKNIRA